MNNRKKPLIMVVDDNPSNIQVLGSILDKNGYEPSVFLNGMDALDSLNDEFPDLILLDIMMPEMDGFEMCEKLKNDMATRDIPIIFITAKTEPEDIVKGFECGAADYVAKPFNTMELLARVKTHVEMKMLRGIIPICAKCKKLRNDQGIWEQVDAYLVKYAGVALSHGLCQDCSDELYGNEEWYEKQRGKNS
jgi:DNA-binding response OmpR family regulator